jgi:hypothetical protein
LKRIFALFLALVTLLALASVAGADPKPPGGGDESQSSIVVKK